MLNYKISSRIPVCATLGRAGLRAGTCAVRRGARVTPPVTDSSVAPQDNLPAVSVEKTEPIAGAAAFVRFSGTNNTPSTINDNQQFRKPPSPPPSFILGESSVIASCAREPRANGRPARVHTCGRKRPPDTVTRRVYSDNTRLALSRRRYRTTSETGQEARSPFSAPIATELRGRAGPPIPKKHVGRRIDAAPWVGIGSVEELARDLLSSSGHRPPREKRRDCGDQSGCTAFSRTVSRSNRATNGGGFLSQQVRRQYGTIYVYLVKDGFDWTSLIIAIAN